MVLSDLASGGRSRLVTGHADSSFHIIWKTCDLWGSLSPTYSHVWNLNSHKTREREMSSKVHTCDGTDNILEHLLPDTATERKPYMWCPLFLTSLIYADICSTKCFSYSCWSPSLRAWKGKKSPLSTLVFFFFTQEKRHGLVNTHASLSWRRSAASVASLLHRHTATVRDVPEIWVRSGRSTGHETQHRLGTLLGPVGWIESVDAPLMVSTSSTCPHFIFLRLSPIRDVSSVQPHHHHHQQLRLYFVIFIHPSARERNWRCCLVTNPLKM